MKSFRRTSLCVLLCFLLFPAVSRAQQNQPQAQTMDAEKWREDLRFMAREMEARHKDLFHTMNRVEFEQAVKDLDDRIPKLQRNQIIVEMMKIVAMVGDGHTNIYQRAT